MQECKETSDELTALDKCVHGVMDVMRKQVSAILVPSDRVH